MFTAQSIHCKDILHFIKRLPSKLNIIFCHKGCLEHNNASWLSRVCTTVQTHSGKGIAVFYERSTILTSSKYVTVEPIDTKFGKIAFVGLCQKSSQRLHGGAPTRTRNITLFCAFFGSFPRS